MRIRAVTLASLLLLAPLDACTDDDADAGPSPTEPTSTTTSSPSPSATETETGPNIPLAAQGTDEASAKAFVRFYFATLSEAMQTGDIRHVTQLSTRRCHSCKSVPARVRLVYRKGGYFTTAGWRVEKIVPYKTRRNSRGFYLRVHEAERQLFDEAGKRIATTPEANTTSQIVVVRASDAWKIDYWAFVE